jgi:hypothetical protein
MRLIRFLFAVAALSVSFLVIPDGTQAKALSKFGKRGIKTSHMNVNVNVMRGDRKTLARTASKQSAKTPRQLANCSCTCAVVQEFAGFGTCFSNCLKDWYINQATIIACAGACVGAGTGNPVGITVCAACLGTGEWIVAGCAGKCFWKEMVGVVESSVKARPSLRKKRTTDRARFQITSRASTL